MSEPTVRLMCSWHFDHLDDCLKKIQTLGFLYFSYGIKMVDHPVVACFSNAEWGEMYIRDQLYKTDPLLLTASKLKNALIPWDAVPIDNKEQYETMQERESISGARHGLSFGIYNKNSFEIIAIGGDETQEKFYDRFVKNKQEIFDICSHIKDFIHDKTIPNQDHSC